MAHRVGTGHELAVVLNRHLLAHPRRSLLELRFGHRVESLVSANARTGCRGVLEGSDVAFERRRIGGDRVGGITATSRREQHWHATGDGRPRRSQWLAQVRGRTTARRSVLAGCERHAPRLAWNYAAESITGTAQALARLVAGAAEVRAVAELARRAHRPMPLVTGSTARSRGRICEQQRHTRGNC